MHSKSPLIRQNRSIPSIQFHSPIIERPLRDVDEEQTYRKRQKNFVEEFYAFQGEPPIHTPAHFDTEVEDAISYLRQKKIGKELSKDIIDRVNKLIEILFATQKLYHSEVRYSGLIEKKLRQKCEELRNQRKELFEKNTSSSELEKLYAIILNICSISKFGEAHTMKDYSLFNKGESDSDLIRKMYWESTECLDNIVNLTKKIRKQEAEVKQIDYKSRIEFDELQNKLNQVSKEYEKLLKRDSESREMKSYLERENKEKLEMESKFHYEKENLEFELKILKKVVDDLENNLRITHEEKKFYQEKLYFLLEIEDLYSFRQVSNNGEVEIEVEANPHFNTENEDPNFKERVYELEEEIHELKLELLEEKSKNKLSSESLQNTVDDLKNMEKMLLDKIEKLKNEKDEAYKKRGFLELENKKLLRQIQDLNQEFEDFRFAEENLYREYELINSREKEKFDSKESGMKQKIQSLELKLYKIQKKYEILLLEKQGENETEPHHKSKAPIILEQEEEIPEYSEIDEEGQGVHIETDEHNQSD